MLIWLKLAVEPQSEGMGEIGSYYGFIHFPAELSGNSYMKVSYARVGASASSYNLNSPWASEKIASVFTHLAKTYLRVSLSSWSMISARLRSGNWLLLLLILILCWPIHSKWATKSPSRDWSLIVKGYIAGQSTWILLNLKCLDYLMLTADSVTDSTFRYLGSTSFMLFSIFFSEGVSSSSVDLISALVMRTSMWTGTESASMRTSRSVWSLYHSWRVRLINSTGLL